MKTYGKVIAAMLAVLISAGSTGIYAVANKNNETTDTKPVKEDGKKEEKTVLCDSADEPVEKNETVYVMTDANGNKTKTIVSDWLKNASASGSISDFSNLSDISSLKLGGGYTADGSDITWSANGGDIYYKGYSEADLPVDIRITYTLDGKSISPEELAGKSGRVTVRYDYINNSKKAVEINGEKTTMYTPFMMATGVLLDGTKFRNVTTENGKVISDGDRLVILGYALPGLTESLGISDKYDVDIPEHFSFTADVSDFEMNTTITSGTSSFFADTDLGDVADLDEIDKKIDELKDACDKLCNGTGDLCKGIEKLQTGAGDLSNGVDRLADGGVQLDDGIGELKDGTGKLSDGTKKLDDATGTLTSGIDSAKSGSDKLVAGFDSAEEGMKSLKNGTSSLSAGLTAAADGAVQVNGGAQQLYDGSNKLSDGAQTLSAGAQSVADGTSSLSESAQALDQGADALAQGASNAKAGADAVSDGIARTNAGACALSQGIDKAGQGAAALASGIEQTGAGVDRLAQGAAAGAQKLNETTEKIGEAADSLETTIEYNRQVIAGLRAMQAAYPTDSQQYAQLEVMINTLEQTTAGQTQIAQGLADGAASSQDDMTALIGGISQLQTAFNGDGTAENPGLVAGANALNNAFTGTEESAGLSDGAKALADGLGSLDGGASQLTSGLEQLENGTGTFADNTKKLVSGTAALDDGAQKVAAGADTLSGSTKQLAGGAGALAQGTQSLADGITAATTGAAALNNGAAALTDGLTKLSNGEKELNGGLSKLSDGGKQLKDGTATLSSSAVLLDDGALKLKDGSSTLVDGLFTLKDGTVSLVDGINKLADGSKTLDDGFRKFKKQGVDKIIKAYNGDIKPLCDRLSKLSELAGDYTNFSGAANGAKTDVKFIYETDAIKPNKE